MQKLLRFSLPLAILLVGWIGYTVLAQEQDEAKRPPPKARAIRTTAEELHLQNYTTVVRTQGVIRPHHEVTLTAQVSGKIALLLPGFEDGSFFAEGEILAQLDSSDYDTAVVASKAQVARASAAFAQEKARAKQAELNWEDLGYDEEPSELVLRIPQMNQAEAEVKAAEAQLDQAERDLDRTRIRAPFDGRVKERIVGVGQSISAGTPLGTIFSIDFAEVRLPVASHELGFLTLPEAPEDEPVNVELTDALNDESETVWHAEIVRTEGTLDEDSRELFAIARLVDPFGRKTGKPPLRIGQPVVGAIAGRVLEDVYVIPRIAVRQLNRIFLIDKNELTLERRTIDPVWTDKDHLVVRDDTIPDGALLSTSHLVYAPNGSKVEIIPKETDAELNAESKPADGESGTKSKEQTGVRRPETGSRNA